MSAASTATLPLERNFHPFVRLPEQQRTALSGALQVVLFDEESLLVLEQVVRPARSRGAVSPPRCLGDVGGPDLLGQGLELGIKSRLKFPNFPRTLKLLFV